MKRTYNDLARDLVQTVAAKGYPLSKNNVVSVESFLIDYLGAGTPKYNRWAADALSGIATYFDLGGKLRMDSVRRVGYKTVWHGSLSLRRVLTIGDFESMELRVKQALNISDEDYFEVVERWLLHLQEIGFLASDEVVHGWGLRARLTYVINAFLYMNGYRFEVDEGYVFVQPILQAGWRRIDFDVVLADAVLDEAYTEYLRKRYVFVNSDLMLKLRQFL